MATVTKTHPVAIGTDLEFFIGKDDANMTFIEVNFGSAVNAKTGPESTIAEVVKTIANECEICIKGDLHGSNQRMGFLIAHGNAADTYDGSNSEAFAAHLEDLIQALGTVDSINLASAAVTAKTSLDFA